LAQELVARRVALLDHSTLSTINLALPLLQES